MIFSARGIKVLHIRVFLASYIDIDNIRQINFVPEIEDRDKKSARPMPDKITIVSDGVKKVQAIFGMTDGTANCHPEDKFDIFAGARIALDRLEKRFKD